MNFYLNWHRNYTWSNFEVCFLLNKYRSPKFMEKKLIFEQDQVLSFLFMVKKDDASPGFSILLRPGGGGDHQFNDMPQKFVILQGVDRKIRLTYDLTLLGGGAYASPPPGSYRFVLLQKASLFHHTKSVCISCNFTFLNSYQG